MPEQRIDLASDRATMILGGRPADTILLTDVRELHVVDRDYGFLHGNEPFYAIVLDDRLWIIPDDVNGLDALIEALVQLLSSQGRIFRTIASKMPWAWRQGRFIRPFPIPRLAPHPIGSRPEWESAPLSEEEIHRIIGANA